MVATISEVSPNITAAITAPRASRTGADTLATPGSRSATLCAQPRRRTSSSVRAVKLADGTTVEDVSYDAQGCSISQASTSVMAEELIGRSVSEAMDKLGAFEEMVTSRGQLEGDAEQIGDGVAFAGVAKFPARVKCALLGWKAFEAATSDALDGKE